MSSSTRQVINDYLSEHDLELPIAGSVREFCRDLASDHEFTANAFRHMYYRMLDEIEEEDKEEPKATPEVDEEPPSNPLGVSTLERDYFYNEINDLYLVWLPHRPKTLQVEGDTVREMKRAYSAMPSGYDTINEICQRFGWRRKDFQAFKQIMGWTHDQDPYTDEEHASTPTPDLVADYASRKRGEFERELRKKEWAETVDKAKKWEAWKRQTLDPFRGYVSENPPRSRNQVPLINPDRAPDPFMAVFSPSDAHLHKACADGRGFADARQDLLDTTDDLIARVAKTGNPDRVVLVLGNDWFHIDNAQGGTTAQTPQDVDGLPGPKLIWQCYELASEVIDRLRTFGNVDVVIVPSNHGEWSDYHMHSGLRFGYRNQPDVSILYDASPRQYIDYGNNVVGLEHGDGAKPDDLPLIMAKEKRELWGKTEYSYWLTGHNHHLKEIDCGAIVMQAPSIAGKDRWHNKKGFVLSERANICYLFDRDKGHTDRMISIA